MQLVCSYKPNLYYCVTRNFFSLIKNYQGKKQPPQIHIEALCGICIGTIDRESTDQYQGHTTHQRDAYGVLDGDAVLCDAMRCVASATGYYALSLRRFSLNGQSLRPALCIPCVGAGDYSP